MTIKNSILLFLLNLKVGIFKLQKVRFSLGILGFLAAMALIGPWITPYTYYEIHLALKNTPPCSTFWMGTDELGRDIFTRICCGARVSLFIGIVAATIDLFIGVIYGSVAAILGGKMEEFLMRVVDILSSIPYLLIVILLVATMGPGVSTVILALTLTGWIPMSRMVRGQMKQLKSLDFIHAAYALGASHAKIWSRHLLPNTWGSILTMTTLTIPTAIFSEAFLSFLGLGCQAPVASWGSMINDALSALLYFPWRLFFPSLCITVTMFCFNLLGEGIREYFDHQPSIDLMKRTPLYEVKEKQLFSNKNL